MDHQGLTRELRDPIKTCIHPPEDKEMVEVGAGHQTAGVPLVFLVPSRDVG